MNTALWSERDVERKRKLITKENQIYIVKRSSPDYIEE